MVKPTWTDYAEDEARKGFHNGDSASAVGILVHKSRSAVIGWWHRHGLKRKSGNTRTAKHIVDTAKARRAYRREWQRQKRKQEAAKQEQGLPVHTAGRPLESLQPDQCRYSVADDNGRNHLMCGAPGYPWCNQHRTIVFKEDQT